MYNVLHVESKTYTYYLSLTIAGGVEERGDRSRGESHPALAAAGAGEGDQHICGRQGALKVGTGSATQYTLIVDFCFSAEWRTIELN